MSGFVFCRDGVLRLQEWHRGSRSHVSLPVRTLECVRQHVFLKQITYGVDLEPGLTVRELFENLAPWADLMEGLACMDFPAFLHEARLPPSPDPELDRVEISYFLTVKSVPDFETPSSRRFLIGRPLRTDRIELEGCWRYIGKLKEPKIEGKGESWEHEIDGYSLDYTPLEKWAHLPITILSKARVLDQTWGDHHLSADAPLLNPAHPMVHPYGKPGEPVERPKRGRRTTIEVPVDAPCPSFMDAIVRGFLWDVGFHYSPPGRDETIDVVNGRADEVDVAIAEGRAEEAFSRVLFEGNEEDEAEAARLDAEQGPEPEEPEDDGANEEDASLEAAIALCHDTGPAGAAAVRGLEPKQLAEILARARARPG